MFIGIVDRERSLRGDKPFIVSPHGDHMGEMVITRVELEEEIKYRQRASADWAAAKAARGWRQLLFVCAGAGLALSVLTYSIGKADGTNQCHNNAPTPVEAPVLKP